MKPEARIPTPEPVPSPEASTILPKKRSVKPKKTPKKLPRRFVQEGDYQNWTNTFSRQTVHWDKSREHLDSEQRREPANNDRCCGNQPDKTHTLICERSMSRSKSPPKKAVVLPEKKLQASQSRASPTKKADPSDVYSGESINITTPTHKEKKRPKTAKKSGRKELSKEDIELFSSKIA